MIRSGFSFMAAVAAAAHLSAGTASAAPEGEDRATTASVAPAKIVIQSHRGAGFLDPENTVEAFELGWKLGTWPEADVRATTDGVIVAFHDNDLKRLVKDAPPELAPKGIADLTWEQVSKLDVGSWMGEKYAGRRVPKLTDVFARMKGHPDRHLYLDIKNVSLPDLAREVKEYGVEAQVVLATPKHEIIREWKRLVPQSDTLLWMSGKKKGELAQKLDAARAANFEGITQVQFHIHMTGKPEDVKRDSVDPFVVSDDFIRKGAAELRSRGILLQTFPWGGSTREVYWKLLDLGAQAFATDHPEVTLEAVRAYKPLDAATEGKM